MNVTVEIERRDSRPAKPEWICPSCKDGAKLADVRGSLFVCPYCGFHARVTANERIRQLTDQESFHELWVSVRTLDPLTFTDIEAYPDRVREAQAKTGLTEAIITGTATIDGSDCVLAVMDFGFPAPGRRVQLGRGAHAGRHPLAHADGQDELRRRRHQRIRDAVRGDPRGPVYGRCRRELRDPRRHLHRGAGRAALVLGPACDRRDDT
jgi:hypothetical protein